MIANFLHRNNFKTLFPGQSSMYDKYKHDTLGYIQICYGIRDNPKIHLIHNHVSNYFNYVYEVQDYLWEKIKNSKDGIQIRKHT